MIHHNSRRGYLAGAAASALFSLFPTATVSFLNPSPAFRLPIATETQLRHSSEDFAERSDRRSFLLWSSGAAFVLLRFPSASFAAEMNVDDFLKTGGVAMPMGVSGQAGKAKPETGVVLRDGSDVQRDGSGNVLAEILVSSADGSSDQKDQKLVLVSFLSPWKVASGGVFDVEARDPKTGDGSFLAVAPLPKGASSVADVPDSYIAGELFKSTGRFSFYGAPTDVRVKKSYADAESPGYKTVEIGFSNLSQSTNAEIPRYSVVSATVPPGTNSLVMLVGSATTSRWKKGAESDVRKTVSSFRAAAAPRSGLAMKAREK
eukprot:CAMPEP_0113312316 /NCGR_PEP_ID=MMETSP0010_2-20120614/9201_1 /TAXON_ID=216773 ORGANISM="Corethron hystrix, Strain 308" /NCGR_SAMPLE_ID=MMETSP0010_2 /ASSEMBLY_ACC=CAM_ASM_000155 /LENGTH=317 /DNA_ID=CAMNT_0000168129 /DNA_START=42 /DNA_END=995 /DNA_ORIENTATION=- /assembly_acc=CAM_ASM_000155